MIKYLDTFAGVGGFHLALENSISKHNIECIGYSEINKFSKQVYNKHFPNSESLGDITSLNIEKLEDFDLLTGGFPCQDVSVAGKQNLEGGGRTILVEYLLQILEKKQPKYFVLENVKGLMNEKFKDFRNSIFKRISDCGYNFDYKVLNTKDFGLPQNRERVFIIGTLSNAKIVFPTPRPLTMALSHILEDKVDEKYYLTKKAWQSFKNNDKEVYIKEDDTCLLDTIKGSTYSKIIVDIPSKFGWTVYNTDGISPTVRDNHGDCVRIKVKATQLGGSKNFGSANNHKHFYCLRTSQPNGVIIDNKIRKLTPTECCRLQGFPDNWCDLGIESGKEVTISNTQKYKQMGNAISVNVVTEIFNNLLKKG